jgi:hypothetical protein
MGIDGYFNGTILTRTLRQSARRRPVIINHLKHHADIVTDSGGRRFEEVVSPDDKVLLVVVFRLLASEALGAPGELGHVAEGVPIYLSITH